MTHKYHFGYSKKFSEKWLETFGPIYTTAVSEEVTEALKGEVDLIKHLGVPKDPEVILCKLCDIDTAREIIKSTHK